MGTTPRGGRGASLVSINVLIQSIARRCKHHYFFASFITVIGILFKKYCRQIILCLQHFKLMT